MGHASSRAILSTSRCQSSCCHPTDAQLTAVPWRMQCQCGLLLQPYASWRATEAGVNNSAGEAPVAAEHVAVAGKEARHLMEVEELCFSKCTLCPRARLAHESCRAAQHLGCAVGHGGGGCPTSRGRIPCPWRPGTSSRSATPPSAAWQQRYINRRSRGCIACRMSRDFSRGAMLPVMSRSFVRVATVWALHAQDPALLHDQAARRCSMRWVDAMGSCEHCV